jgi:hypothetical protein
VITYCCVIIPNIEVLTKANHFRKT